MNGDELDRELHDYVDGRLSEADRRAFEQRMEREPQVRRRVESYRSIGATLRETEIELPPGFYARARERFESSRSAAPRWRRLISWEGTGLAAAAVLLVAILLPQVWEQRGTDELLPPPPVSSKPAAPAKSKSIVSETEGLKVETRTDDDEEAPIRTVRSAPRQQPVTPAEMAQDQALGDVAGDPEARLFAETDAVDTPAVAAAAPEPERVEPANLVGGRDAGEVPRKESAAADLESVGEVQAEAEIAREMSHDEIAELSEPLERELDEADSLTAAHLEKTTTDAYATALPDGFMKNVELNRRAKKTSPDRLLIVVEDPETWDRMRAERRYRDFGEAAVRAPDFSIHRLVLIGPQPEPFDCKSLRWRSIDGAIVIEAEATRAATVPSPGGCALWVPAGDEPVVLRLEDR